MYRNSSYNYSDMTPGGMSDFNFINQTVGRLRLPNCKGFLTSLCTLKNQNVRRVLLSFKDSHCQIFYLSFFSIFSKWAWICLIMYSHVIIPMVQEINRIETYSSLSGPSTSKIPTPTNPIRIAIPLISSAVFCCKIDFL